jgi:hypothetical protein
MILIRVPKTRDVTVSTGTSPTGTILLQFQRGEQSSRLHACETQKACKLMCACYLLLPMSISHEKNKKIQTSSVLYVNVQKAKWQSLILVRLSPTVETKIRDLNLEIGALELANRALKHGYLQWATRNGPRPTVAPPPDPPIPTGELHHQPPPPSSSTYPTTSFPTPCHRGMHHHPLHLRLPEDPHPSPPRPP